MNPYPDQVNRKIGISLNNEAWLWDWLPPWPSCCPGTQCPMLGNSVGLLDPISGEAEWEGRRPILLSRVPSRAPTSGASLHVGLPSSGSDSIALSRRSVNSQHNRLQKGRLRPGERQVSPLQQSLEAWGWAQGQQVSFQSSCS